MKQMQCKLKITGKNGKEKYEKGNVNLPKDPHSPADDNCS